MDPTGFGRPLTAREVISSLRPFLLLLLTAYSCIVLDLGPDTHKEMYLENFWPSGHHGTAYWKFMSSC